MSRSQILLENVKIDRFSTLTGLKLPKFGPNDFFPKTFSLKKTWTKKCVTGLIFLDFRGILRSHRGPKMVEIGKSQHVSFSNIFESKCILSLTFSECIQFLGMFHMVSVIMGQIEKNCPFLGEKGQKCVPKPLFSPKMAYFDKVDPINDIF